MLTTWEHISQTVAFYQKRNRREKIKTLRLLSKLNKNIQYLPDAIIICHHDGTILWCNNVSQEMLNFYWDKKLEKSVFSVIFYEEFKSISIKIRKIDRLY
ncbi:phosphate regulon sensor protein [Actinobacillus equuli]|nr:phosphate regulon sensor protein [Actinobacillus equuli]